MKRDLVAFFMKFDTHASVLNVSVRSKFIDSLNLAARYSASPIVAVFNYVK